MINPANEDKVSTVIMYSADAMIHGSLVTKANVRVSVWLRTQGVPNYIHLYKAQVIKFGSIPPKVLTYKEIFFPTEKVLAFHLAPPAADVLDYDTSETNRKMEDVSLLVGYFTVNGKVRISTQAELATSIELSHLGWLSVYDVTISNTFVTQMPAVQVPMMLVRPGEVSFGV